MLHNASHLANMLRRPWAVWLALCVALLGALAPTVSHALSWARGGNAGLVEVCTSTGPRWMALPGMAERASNTPLEDAQASSSVSALTMQPDGPRPATVLDHCPFCLLFADRIAPPPQAWQAPLALAQAAAPHWPRRRIISPFFTPTRPHRAGRLLSSNLSNL
jgi:hypothetical protein